MQSPVETPAGLPPGAVLRLLRAAHGLPAGTLLRALDRKAGSSTAGAGAPSAQNDKRNSFARDDRQSGIGSTEPETGRPVLQQSPRAEVTQAAATAEHHSVKETLGRLLSYISGAKLAGAREEKDPERLEEKIEGEGQSPRTVRDYSGFRISVDSPQAHQAVADALRRQFEIPDEQDEFERGNPETGFHGHTLQVREPGSPVSHEVQVLPREVAEHADSRHGLYEHAREGDAAAAQKLKTANEGDWARFEARQPSGVSGQGSAKTKADPSASLRSAQDDKPNGSAQDDRPKGAGERFRQMTTARRADAKDPVAEKKSLEGRAVMLADGKAGVVAHYQPAVNGNPARMRVRLTDGKIRDNVKPEEMKPVTAPKPDPDSEWIGVDMDGTLAKYHGFQGKEVLGGPVEKMVDRVKAMLAAGKDVRILTARISDDRDGTARAAIEAWCQQHLGRVLPITDVKDNKMKQLWDDRAVGVERNTGEIK